MHLGDDLLSAYLDGELTPAEAVVAAAHLRTCAGCADTARLYAALDERLTTIPALACSAALTLVSARLDGELDGEESAIAAAHLAGCDRCRGDVFRWSVAEQAIASFPLSRPAARVDAAIAALGREPAGRRLPRIAWPVPALAVATALSVLLVLNLSLGPRSPVGPTAALVAGVQQSILNSANGSLYVLHPEDGTVAVLNAETLQPQSLIHVGGRPTALALNSAMNTLLVLDAGAKTVTSIDCAYNTVTSSTAFAAPGTPTSLQVDTDGNVLVSAVVSVTSSASSAPSASPAPAGILVVLNPGTGQVRAVKQVDVATQVLILEPNGRRALLVSADKTTLLDAATYEPLASAVGGVAAAFAAAGDDFAILLRAADGARVSFARRNGSIFVGGTPHAIAALPDGGFAILSDLNGRGEITLLAPDGSLTATLDAPPGARDLAFDAASRTFAVIAASGVTNVGLPATLAKAPPVSQNGVAAAATPTPLPTAKSTPQASATPAPTEPATLVVPPPADNTLVPTGARAVWPGTYVLSVGTAKRPDRAAGDLTRIWYVDDENHVNALHPATGELFAQIASLPVTANIGRIAASPDHVYLADAVAGVLYVLTIDTEQLRTVPLPAVSAATAMVASPDERVWIGTPGSGLVSYDPRISRVETIAIAQNLSALASDGLGRIWLASRDREALDLYDPLSAQLTEIAFSHAGSITALIVDRSGALWVGTDTGQVIAMRNATVEFTTGLGLAITGFVLDEDGAAWYVSVGNDLAYGRATSPAIPRHSPIGSSGPMFDQLGRVWQADRSADGFYVTLPEGQR